MKALHMAAFILVIVGALNWGLTAFGYNVVNMLVGAWPTVETIVYVLVGLSALYLIFSHKAECRTCNASAAM